MIAQQPPRQILALQTFTKLMRAADTIAGKVHRHLAEYDLSVSQFGVLEALLHLGPMCQKDIAAKILKSTGNITMVIDNLEKRGLVIRNRMEKDRRYFSIDLSPQGKKLIARIFPRHAEQIDEAMSLLDDDEQRLLGRLCKKFKRLRENDLPTQATSQEYRITKPTRIYND